MSDPEGLRIARELIAEEAEAKTGSLNLGVLGLSEIPTEISELSHLTTLCLSPSPRHALEKFGVLRSETGHSIAHNTLSDLQPLAGLTRLTTLDCGSTQVSDLQPLSALTGLTTLSCRGTRVSDLQPLSALTSLTTLHCSFTQVTDLRPLSALTSLATLNCFSTLVSDFRPLSALTSFATLRCGSTLLTDLQSLSALTSLATLDCSSTAVNDLQPLSALTSLATLNCSFTMVSDFRPLSALTSLTTLDCRGTQVTDLQPLSALTSLTTLDCSVTLMSDAGLLDLAAAYQSRRLPQLKHLNLVRTQVTIDASTIRTHDPAQIFEALLHGRILREARVMFLGMDRVGKSWLFRRCFLDEIVDPREQPHSTKDMHLIRPETCVWRPEIVVDDISVPVETRVWDFAGQLVNHGPHEAFLPSEGRTVYVVVLDAGRVVGSGAGRTDNVSGNRLPYWLHSVRHFAGSTVPVVVAVTKCDTDFSGERPVDDPFELAAITSSSLRLPSPPSGENGSNGGSVRLTDLEPDAFGDVYGASVKAIVDGCSAIKEELSIEPLRDAIELAVGTLSAVRDGKVHPKLPALRDLVRSKMEGQALAAVDDFKVWCRDDSVDIQDSDLQESSLKTLHYMGELFYFGQTQAEIDRQQQERDDMAPGLLRISDRPTMPLLQKYFFHAEFLKQCVYSIVQESVSPKHQGWFTEDEINSFIATAASHNCSPDAQAAVREFLDLMELAWFDAQQKKYLLPRGLPEKTPTSSGTWPKSSLLWDFIPEANFHRLVVRLHHLGRVVKEEGTWRHWRYAVLMQHRSDPATQAAAVAFPEEGRVEVRFSPTGNSALWASLLDFVVEFFEDDVKQGKLAERPAVPDANDESRTDSEVEICRAYAENLRNDLKGMTAAEAKEKLIADEPLVPTLDVENEAVWIHVSRLPRNRDHFRHKRKKTVAHSIDDTFGIDSSAQIWRASGQDVYYYGPTIDSVTYPFACD